MTRVVIVTGDPLGERLAGPGIRALAIARDLQSAGHEVRVITTAGGELARPEWGIRIHAVSPGDDRAMRVHAAWADVVIVQGYALGQFPTLATTDRVLIADLYAPFHLELAEQGRAPTSHEDAATIALRVEIAERAIRDQLGRADLILAANGRQQELYRRMLAGVGRVPGDALFRMVPFGLDAEPPQRAMEPVVRGVIPGIPADARLIVWGGGLYDWFDPLTLVRAMARVRERLPEARLLFMGTRNPRVGEPGMVGETLALAEKLGLAGETVIFNDDWVPYDERGAWLLEADAGVSTHPVHDETRYAFRTRILDYLWAGLPMVVTEGDGFADLVAHDGIGIVVPEGDDEALADALVTVLSDAEAAARFRAAIPAVAARFAWPHALAPLRRFVERPVRATDYRPGREGMSRLGAVQRTTGLRHDLRMGWHHLRASGLRGVLERVRRRRGSSG